MRYKKQKNHLLPQLRPGPTNPEGFIACSVCTVDCSPEFSERDAVQRVIFILAYAPRHVNVMALH
jgi:hypothetical protein